MIKEIKITILLLLAAATAAIAADTFIMFKNTRFNTGQVTVTTGYAITIPETSTTTRRAVEYCNDSDNKVYLGSTTATTINTGHVLFAGICKSFEINPLTASTTYFFVSGTTGNRVTFIEMQEPLR